MACSSPSALQALSRLPSQVPGHCLAGPVRPSRQALAACPSSPVATAVELNQLSPRPQAPKPPVYGAPVACSLPVASPRSTVFCSCPSTSSSCVRSPSRARRCRGNEAAAAWTDLDLTSLKPTLLDAFQVPTQNTLIHTHTHSLTLTWFIDLTQWLFLSHLSLRIVPLAHSHSHSFTLSFPFSSQPSS